MDNTDDPAALTTRDVTATTVDVMSDDAHGKVAGLNPEDDTIDETEADDEVVEMVSTLDVIEDVSTLEDDPAVAGIQ